MQGSISFDGGLNGSIVSSGSLSGSIDTSGSGSTVTIQPTLFEGQKIANYTIDGVDGELYAPEGSGGGSDVDIDPALSAGVKIADFTIDGVDGELYAPAAADVDITPTYDSGVKVADYDIDGNTGSIYVPKYPAFNDWTEYQVGYQDVSIGSDDEYIDYSFIYYKHSSITGKRCILRGFEFYINDVKIPVQPIISMEDSTRIWFNIIIPNPSKEYIDKVDYMIYLLCL